MLQRRSPAEGWGSQGLSWGVLGMSKAWQGLGKVACALTVEGLVCSGGFPQVPWADQHSCFGGKMQSARMILHRKLRFQDG